MSEKEMSWSFGALLDMGKFLLLQTEFAEPNTWTCRRVELSALEEKLGGHMGFNINKLQLWKCCHSPWCFAFASLIGFFFKGLDVVRTQKHFITVVLFWLGNSMYLTFSLCVWWYMGDADGPHSCFCFAGCVWGREAVLIGSVQTDVIVCSRPTRVWFCRSFPEHFLHPNSRVLWVFSVQRHSQLDLLLWNTKEDI